MPAIGGSDRISIIGFRWDGTTYLYEAGQVIYTPVEDIDTWKFANDVNAYNWNHLHLQFLIFAGYLDQQLNAGSSYTLADATVIPSAAAKGAMDLLNAIKDSNTEEVTFFPAYQDSFGIVDTTSYAVNPLPSGEPILNAQQAGRFTPYTPIQFITKNSLDDYPSWANR
jgi:hypothetical protein